MPGVGRIEAADRRVPVSRLSLACLTTELRLMLAILAKVLLGMLAGYAVGAVAGGLLIGLLSGNSHDKAQEVAMTAFFVCGPAGAVLGALAGLVHALFRTGS